ncbi:hypothetical protein C8F04DRAFT_1194154 [Mycena alexandri]|uniref:Uncharacterized protein n=1 Tax=Mycena alexandri TaxID=1745969 RepID=A0AAD6S7Y9_9AGAR|nr:hypothetical protein C8F04DRAFT_1194154 [Mycena alexandri]
MPELRETSASGLIAQEGIETVLAASSSLVVEDIVADATAAEAGAPDASDRAKQGLPYSLDSTSTIVRGSLNHQTPVYPPMLRVIPDTSYPPTPYPPSLRSLTLCAVQSTHRALILKFGTLCLMVQYLTPTSVQWYSREKWDNAIMMVSKDVRKFHIGMALVFAEYLLAFVTIDLLFQPTWVEDILELLIPPNIYTSTSEFLFLVAGWISSENLLAGKKYQLACNVIRDANKIFYGIGIYTVMELFYMAGLSPFLTVYELFSNPSRTARFLAVFYTYIHEGESNLCPFGPLVFGPWTGLSMGGSIPTAPDPLTALYMKHDLLGKSTKLAPDLYIHQLFLPATDLKQARRDTFTHSGPKEMWSITRNFPPTLHWSDNPKNQAKVPKVNQLTGAHRTSMLFKSIVQGTQSVSIGPLKYCGNGHIVYLGNVPHLVVCKGDPTIPQYHEERTLCGLYRVSTKLGAPGKRKRAHTENKALDTKLRSIKAGYNRVRASGEKSEAINESEDCVQPKAKKRRLSADQRLALMSI